MVVYMGETVEIQNTITDKYGTLVNPDTQSIEIYDPLGTLKDTITTPTKVSDGVYFIDYTIPTAGPDGTWKLIWKITYSSDIGIEAFTFPVTKP